MQYYRRYRINNQSRLELIGIYYLLIHSSLPCRAYNLRPQLFLQNLMAFEKLIILHAEFLQARIKLQFEAVRSYPHTRSQGPRFAKRLFRPLNTWRL